MYSIVYTKRAINDIALLKNNKLDRKAKDLIKILRENPYKTPPNFEKLQGKLKGALSRRINVKHRLVYQVFENEKVVKIISLWSHYE